MAPFKSSKGRNLGKQLKPQKSSSIGFELASGTISVTGGTKTSPGNGYTYHIFTYSGSPESFTITNGSLQGAEVLIVAGGGGGGRWPRRRTQPLPQRAARRGHRVGRDAAPHRGALQQPGGGSHAGEVGPLRWCSWWWCKWWSWW